MVPVYDKALSIFPTFFFIILFLIMSAVYFTRYHSEESDEVATKYYRDYLLIMNSMSSIISVLNGIIIIVLYDWIALGVTLILITQALSVYVYVALYMNSHYDALFFLSFSVLAYVYEFFYFVFYGTQVNLFGRTVGAFPLSIIAFIILIVVLSSLIAGLAVYVNRKTPNDDLIQ